jgi:mono/diheme cytochrome c family protein
MRLLIGLSLLVASVAGAQTPDGKALYNEKCVMCHDKTGMGTGILSRRVKVAELLLRNDLNAEFVAIAARSGIGNMPAIPRGEVSDVQLKAIADYLAQSPEAKK